MTDLVSPAPTQQPLTIGEDSPTSIVYGLVSSKTAFCLFWESCYLPLSNWFENAKAQNNYAINHLKNVMEIPEKELEELKEIVDEYVGLN